MTRICITPFVQGTGGMASFRLKFEAGLKKRDIQVTYNLDDKSDAVLVIAGTRFLRDLKRAQKKGIRLTQRLDGINWVHRVKWSGVRYTARAIYGNFMLSLIRNQFADRVIYQSQFIKKWWEDWYGIANKPSNVVVNAVDLNVFTPEGAGQRPNNVYRMLLLEGSLARGLNSGLFHALAVAEKLAEKFPMEVVVAGTVDEQTQKKLKSRVPVKFLGTVEREKIPELIRSSHLMYCAEINPPCPNAVIESLACGLPVIGFDSGSLKELVGTEAGVIVPYGADPWKLETPDISALAQSGGKVLENQDSFRRSARKRAESEFGLDQMVESYLKVLLG